MKLLDNIRKTLTSVLTRCKSIGNKQNPNKLEDCPSKLLKMEKIEPKEEDDLRTLHLKVIKKIPKEVYRKKDPFQCRRKKFKKSEKFNDIKNILQEDQQVNKVSLALNSIVLQENALEDFLEDSDDCFPGELSGLSLPTIQTNLTVNESKLTNEWVNEFRVLNKYLQRINHLLDFYEGSKRQNDFLTISSEKLGENLVKEEESNDLQLYSQKKKTRPIDQNYKIKKLNIDLNSKVSCDQVQQINPLVPEKFEQNQVSKMSILSQPTLM